MGIEHRTGWKENTRDIGAQSAHEHRRNRLIAPPHQNRSIDGVAPQDLFGLHRQQVAIEHGGGFHKHFAQAHDRDFHWKSSGLEHPAFDLLNPLAEMRVAGIHLAPGIEHTDDRFVLEVLVVEPHPFESRSVSEAA